MKKILLVDDDLKNSMLLKRFIEAEGYDLTYAPNGKNRSGIIPGSLSRLDSSRHKHAGDERL